MKGKRERVKEREREREGGEGRMLILTRKMKVITTFRINKSSLLSPQTHLKNNSKDVTK